MLGGKAHRDLGDGESDDLGVGRLSFRILLGFWQKIIGCAISNGSESVEVGVHRGLRAHGVLDTVAFGPSASTPFFRVMFVASII